MFTGAGVGLVIPSLSAVVAVSLPQHRWGGAGSALVNTARQIGIALGTAITILLCQPTIDLTAIRHGWIFLAASATTAAVTAAAAAAYWRDYTTQTRRFTLRAARPSRRATVDGQTASPHIE